MAHFLYQKTIIDESETTLRRDPAIHDINKTNKESKLEPSETPAMFLGADDELSPVQACQVQIRLSNPSSETTRHTQFFLPNRGVVITAEHSKYSIPCKINPTGDAVFRFSELYRPTATRTRRIRGREELHHKSVGYLRRCLRTLESLRGKVLKRSTDAITSISLEDHPLFRLIDLKRDQHPIGSERTKGAFSFNGLSSLTPVHLASSQVLSLARKRILENVEIECKFPSKRPRDFYSDAHACAFTFPTCLNVEMRRGDWLSLALMEKQDLLGSQTHVDYSRVVYHLADPQMKFHTVKKRGRLPVIEAETPESTSPSLISVHPTHMRVALEHSLASLHAPVSSLLHFHRPALKSFLSLRKCQSWEVLIDKKPRFLAWQNLQESTYTYHTFKELSLRYGHFALFEYLDERPLLLGNCGMVSRVMRDTSNLGNGMYTASVQITDLKPQDFLLIVSRQADWKLRKIQCVYISQVQEMKMLVPHPQSRELRQETLPEMVRQCARIYNVSAIKPKRLIPGLQYLSETATHALSKKIRTSAKDAVPPVSLESICQLESTLAGVWTLYASGITLTKKYKESAALLILQGDTNTRRVVHHILTQIEKTPWERSSKVLQLSTIPPSSHQQRFMTPSITPKPVKSEEEELADLKRIYCKKPQMYPTPRLKVVKKVTVNLVESMNLHVKTEYITDSRQIESLLLGEIAKTRKSQMPVLLDLRP